ncbi:conserved hypothetical protein [Verticillium alfalfae VaMs.102]|uniref:MUC1 Extracellular alpha-1,4-glucan glucosidase n=1 Tax=Verticillium alfalfae (strain VaMs.102 / ATCC MYA-4576 / FGSC 10136) TaxID=526221 RepID=C9SKX6_VERA1|nr:conserved hypothetical protein [Verticillium alfalfae VaMs.102]EEY19344.1 conserved hypothetical protein [Verticillium alfalfae VaMs.102]
MVSPLPPPAPTPPTGAMVPPTGDRTSNLLNLLKFSGAGGQPSQAQAQTFQQSQDSFQHFQQHQPQPQHQPQQQQQQHQQPQHALQHHQQSHHQAQHQHQHQAGPAMQAPAPFPTQILAPAPSSQDPSGLLRALMSGSHENEEPKQHDTPPTATFGAASPPDETRTYLLNLLNRPKPSQNDQPLLNEGSRHGSFQQSNESPVDTSRHLHQVLDNASQGQSSSHLSQHNQYETSDRHHYEQPAAGYGSYSFQPNQDGSIPVSRLFGNSYNNYEDHQTPSSQHHTPKSSNAAVPHAHSAGQSPAGPPFLILKKGDGSPTPPGAGRKNISHERSPLASPQSLRSQAVHSNVSPAGNAIGNPTPGSAASLASPGRADRNPETVSEAMHDLAETADQEAQEALARAEDEPDQSDYLKDLDDLDNARTEQEFEDIAQHAALAIKKELDRAENSDRRHRRRACAVVKVYNFPMRPWISIQVNDNGDIERPQLRDEAIMDIARLRKEFDQIDRNLYTATERYMVYGMSKAGGLRVIRQEDGRDAKIFTDTKDRIFNVAMSCTAPDHDGAHRETIIGTGISGTVFWVQIRNGEKDHIEDANPEQYGFALPPMSFHEGDTPGGVLKTRARSSTIHPEFFAVGRGKSINIIWPSFIMQQNLFKPGHDRVVDTEQLAKQCSLKINTGKAGKDFTFSQDDTVIVSLDKSGRVKFWDVRDLTAAKEGSDPRAPIPAHTSLELWDLALGKPVQEFNLPHSKESDAVCSVMYHAPTGMLIIGHPTRNSIYFAHLSAPKYNLKSVSQVDYIKRLIDHDTTIPQPDSTAVISGVREYSFANRGILRSLDLLSTPAMSQDSDEPTLFELYAMHSKGVACLLIKQAELGWSKDNKVLAPVSAVDAGVVSISKLKPPHALPAEPAHQEPAPAPAAPARSNTKESTAHTAPSSQDEDRHAPRGFLKKQESKDEDTPTTAPVKDDKPEKAERKGRKKKAAAVAAAAALAAESQSQSNGGSQSPRVTPKDSKTATAAAPAVPSSYVSMESIETVMNSLTTMESRLNSSFAGTINAAIKSLHTKLEDGQREREKDFDQHQKTLLTMISDVLNENTQKVLESLIQGQFDLAMPTISDVARKAVSEQFSSGTNRQLSQTIQKEINKSLPSATQHALQSTDFIKGLSDRVGSTVAANVQREVVHSLTNQMSTAFTTMATTACQQVADDLQRQHHAEMTALHEQRAADSKKIDELHTAFAQLTSMVSGMAATQEQFQTEFIRFQQQTTKNPGPLQQPIPAQQHQLPPAIQGQEYGPRHGQGPSQVHSQGLTQMQQQVQRMQEHMQQQQQQQQQGSQHYGSMQSPETSQHRSVGYQQSQASSHGHGQHGAPYQQSHANSQALTLANQSQGEEEFDQELADCVARIDGLIKAGRTEDALLRWLQSGREQFIFDRLMSKYSPQLVLDGMPGLLLLTIATTICQSLDSVTRERVAWLEVVVHKISTDFDNMEADARAITPKIFHLIITNTENLFVRISSTRGNDPILKNLSQMMGVAKRTLETHSTRHYG